MVSGRMGSCKVERGGVRWNEVERGGVRWNEVM